MKLSEFKTNAAAIEQGRWVGDLPGLKGVAFKVRGLANVDARRLRAKLTAEVPIKERRAGLDILTADEIDTRVMLDTCLLDWRGIENEDGTLLTFSKAKAEEFLTDPNLVSFRNAVSYAAQMVAEDEAEGEEHDVGNSSGASAGT